MEGGACGHYGCWTCCEQGAREERRRAAKIMEQLLENWMCSEEGIDCSVCDEITQPARAYIAEAEAE